MARLREMFGRGVPAGKPGATRRSQMFVARALQVYRRTDGGVVEKRELAPELAARVVSCRVCGKAGGTLQRVMDGVYAHRGCATRGRP